MDLPELLSSPSMWSHGFPAIRVTQERPLERALIVRNSSAEGETGAGQVAFSVELHVTTLSTPPGGPRWPPEHVPRPGQGRVHIVDSPTTRVKSDGRRTKLARQDILICTRQSLTDGRGGRIRG